MPQDFETFLDINLENLNVFMLSNCCAENSVSMSYLAHWYNAIMIILYVPSSCTLCESAAILLNCSWVSYQIWALNAIWDLLWQTKILFPVPVSNDTNFVLELFSKCCSRIVLWNLSLLALKILASQILVFATEIQLNAIGELP